MFRKSLKGTVTVALSVMVSAYIATACTCERLQLRTVALARGGAVSRETLALARLHLTTWRRQLLR